MLVESSSGEIKPSCGSEVMVDIQRRCCPRFPFHSDRTPRARITPKAWMAAASSCCHSGKANTASEFTMV